MPLTGRRSRRDLRLFLLGTPRRALLHRRSRDIEHVELIGQRGDDPAPGVELAAEDHLAERGLCELQTTRLEVGDGRYRHRLDRLPGHALEVAEHPVLARLRERDRHAGTAGAPSAADAMHVRVGGVRHVVVHHVRHVLHVESACRDVGGDEQVRLVGAELLHHPVALLLREPAVQCLGVVAARVERLGELVDLGAGAAEHDRALRLLHVEDPSERRHLVRARHEVRHLSHLRDLSRLERLVVDPDDERVPQVRPGDGRDARRERGREERDLLLLGCRSEDRFEVLGESHVEHLIGLVEHHRAHRCQVHRLATDVIECASGRGDHHVDAALEGADLRLHRRATVDRHRDRAESLAVAVDRLGDLHRKLAGGHEHERGGAFARCGIGIQVMQQRDREGGRLAGTGRGLRQHVTPGEKGRDRGALDGRRLFVAECRERGEDTRVEGERGEARGGC